MTKFFRKLSAFRPKPLLAIGLALVAAAPGASPQSAKPFKIGVIEDLTGPYAGIAGPGTVESVKMAVEDVGGKVLGRPIEVVVATDQNKPDIGVGIARRWFEQEDVVMITGLQSSNTALAVQNVARELNRIDIVTSAASADITGKGCSPTGFHWSLDTSVSSSALVDALIRLGGKRWFFITVDYNFGLVLEEDAKAAIAKSGGTMLGSARHPLGTLDYSSMILSAQASGADVIGLANAGSDLNNTIKAANEFRLLQGSKVKVAAFFLHASTVEAVGQNLAKGFLSPTSFIPFLNGETKAWTARWAKRMGHDRSPTALQASAYGAVTHYLKSVAAAGTEEAKAVAEKMRELPVNDMNTKNGSVRKDGRFIRDIYIAEVKDKASSKDKYDLYSIAATVPADRAFRSLAESGCPYAQ